MGDMRSRVWPPLLITCVLLGAQASFGILESAPRTLAAIGAAVVCEVLLGRFLTGVWSVPVSAYITGISVGILIRSPLVWPYVFCSGLSIASKYVFRWRGRHLWNPSNLGVSVMLFLVPSAVAGLSVQWGNSIWVMLGIWAFGLVTVWRLRRLHVCVTYVASFLVFGFVRSVWVGQPYLAAIAPVTGPMYQLFVLFMITDPKTTVGSVRGRCTVAFLVAMVEAALRLNEVIYAPFYALFLVGPIALVVEIWKRAR